MKIRIIKETGLTDRPLGAVQNVNRFEGEILIKWGQAEEVTEETQVSPPPKEEKVEAEAEVEGEGQ